MKATFTAAVLLLAAPLSLQAQQVWKCGNSYSQVPCEGGTAVKVDDKRSASETAAVEAATKRDTKLASEMEKARLQQEAKAAPASVVQQTKTEPPPAPPSREAQPHEYAKKAKGGKPAHFTAVAPKKPGDKPAPRKKKKKSA